MSEKISLYDLVAIEAMSAIIAKRPCSSGTVDRLAEERKAVLLGAFSYANDFVAMRAERDQSSNAASLGEELRLLRQQRDEALSQVNTLRAALKPFADTYDAMVAGEVGRFDPSALAVAAGAIGASPVSVDEANLRQALMPLFGFDASFDRPGPSGGGVVTITASTDLDGFHRACKALHQLLGDAP